MILPRVEELRMDNGLCALLVERRTLPVVASTIWYRVGSRDERTGETGLSHFLEHMMFKGTDRYGKGEIDLLTSQMGGSNNAFTDNDVTGYYFSLASDRWEKALEIEANRMRGCLLDEEEFDAERNVVLEELAMGEDDPWRSLYQATEALAYQVHPYHHPIIGWKEDVEKVSVDTMRGYYRRHYAPNNAFFVVVGDIDVEETRQRITDLFRDIEPVGDGRSSVLSEPDSQGERRTRIRSPGDTTRVAIAVKTCRMGEDDDFALDVLSSALTNGKSSRLYRRMVLADQLVTDVSTYNEVRLDPGLFWFTFELTPGIEPAQVESCMREELDRVVSDGLTEDELRRARIQLDAAFLFEEETALDSAIRLGRWESSCKGGYRLLADVEEMYAAVDSGRIRDLAARYMSPDKWQVSHSVPSPDATGERGE